jgi:hypothetical protein
MAKKLNAGVVFIAFALNLCAPNIVFAAESYQSISTVHNYSVQEITKLFRRPKSTMHLLRNMKLAFDRNLLVQPAFFDHAVLKEVFDGTAVTESESGEVVVLDNRIFPGMTVHVHQTNIPVIGANAAGPPHEYIPAHSETFNYIQVETGPIVAISVQLVKNVFGGECQEQMDFGEDTDGHSHIPTTKGSLNYSESHHGPGEATFNKRSASFVVSKDLVEEPRQAPLNGARQHYGLKDDDVIETMTLAGSASVL